MNLSRFIQAMRSDLSDPSRRWRNPRDGREMVVQPAGMARLGPAAEPVFLPAYSMSRHPVTNGEFWRFCAESSYTPDPAHPHGRPLLSHLHGQPPAGDDRHRPVVWVSLLDAQAYCRWAGLVLPDERMWERAARGTDGRRHPWGDQYPSPALCTIQATQPAMVGQHPDVRTATGCADMIGNVSEWCHPGAAGTPVEPGTALAPVRGSAYMRQPSPARMSCAASRQLSRLRRTHWVGFRPASLQTGPA